MVSNNAKREIDWLTSNDYSGLRSACVCLKLGINKEKKKQFTNNYLQFVCLENAFPLATTSHQSGDYKCSIVRIIDSYAAYYSTPTTWQTKGRQTKGVKE